MLMEEDTLFFIPLFFG